MAGRKNHQFYFHDLPQQEKRKGMICKKRGAGDDEQKWQE